MNDVHTVQLPDCEPAQQGYTRHSRPCTTSQQAAAAEYCRIQVSSIHVNYGRGALASSSVLTICKTPLHSVVILWSCCTGSIGQLRPVLLLYALILQGGLPVLTELATILFVNLHIRRQVTTFLRVDCTSYGSLEEIRIVPPPDKLYSGVISFIIVI
jgi:hypothetical protein